MNNWFHGLAAFVLGASAALATPFRNLDFESTKLKFPVVTQPTVADAIPGWSLEIGGQPALRIGYNSTCLSCPQASLYDSNLPGIGRFNFAMTAGMVVNSSPPVVLSTSLYQVGDVPSDARSLVFDGFVGFGTLDVSLGGSLAPVVDLGIGPSSFHHYGIDVTAWAGKPAELRFTINPAAPPFAFGTVNLDNIRFSSDTLVTVPEPATWALFGVGFAALGQHLRRRKA